MSIDDTITSRQSTHGDFKAVAHVSQGLKGFFTNQPGYAKLSEVQREVLDMAATKIARILCGDPNHPDHWHDIGGYSALAEEELAVPADEITQNIEKLFDQVEGSLTIKDAPKRKFPLGGITNIPTKDTVLVN